MFECVLVTILPRDGDLRHVEVASADVVIGIHLIPVRVHMCECVSMCMGVVCVYVSVCVQCTCTIKNHTRVLTCPSSET
jgi:hypothetical protein